MTDLRTHFPDLYRPPITVRLENVSHLEGDERCLMVRLSLDAAKALRDRLNASIARAEAAPPPSAAAPRREGGV